MMVSTKLMPVTGQNMPLLSMGGTSAWFTCIAFGMVLGVSREQMRSSKKETSTTGTKNQINKEVEDAIA
jgi:cell division protein FtsW